MYDLDVPDLIGAIADRFEEYDISLREAAIITVETLAHAMDAVEAESERVIDIVCSGEATANAIRQRVRRTRH
jgi:hypothetical protein